MRIEFLTQDDPIYVLPFFDEFVRHYASRFQILHIATSRTMGKRPRTQMLKELRQLYGVVGLARLMSRFLASKASGAFPLKASASHSSTLAQLCRAYKIPHSSINSPNEAEFVESVRRRRPDVLISVACPYVLKEPLLNIAAKGAINIHHAPLPRYKGMMPTFWQMYHGEKTVGLTIHTMVAKIDEGDALYQGELAIEPGESLDKLIQRSKRHGAHCMAQVLYQLEAGSIQPLILDHSKGSYFTFPTADEISEFHRRGLRAI